MESLTRRSRRITQPTILFILLLLTAFTLLVSVDSTVSRKLLQRSRPLPPSPRPNESRPVRPRGPGNPGPPRPEA
ncbi:hypothetical protein MKX03_006724 [Papaver bracteatum]|nr:hypothetical protein MKX03_006724 [Papaver bracteatum]